MNRRWAALALCMVACGPPDEPAGQARFEVTGTTGSPAARRCGAGELGFDAPREESTAGGAEAALATERMNADMLRDLVFVRGSVVHAALADGSGGFAPPIRRDLGAGRALAALVTGDFDGDGVIDVAVADANDLEAVYVVGGTPDGGLGGAIERVVLGARYQPAAMAARDLDGDGRSDLVIAGRGAGAVSVRLHTATGPVLRAYALPARVVPSAVAIADLNGDAQLDIVTSDRDSAQLVVLEGSGASFDAPAAYDMGHASGIADFAIGDVNGDGGPDLVSMDAAGRLAFRVLTVSPAFASCGTASLVYEPPGGRGLACGGAAGCTFAAVDAADIDADGFDDLVVAAAGAPSDIRILYGSPEGPGAAVELSSASDGARSLALADVNGDARTDVLIGSAAGAVVTVASRCACTPPWTGTRCEQCTASTCPNVGSALDEQLTPGRPTIVASGAELVRNSETPVSDERAAARVAQELAALAHDSDVVVIAHAASTTQRVGVNNRQRVAETVTELVVDHVIAGDPNLQGVRVVQAGGSLDGRPVRASHAVPFPTVGELAALCSSGAHHTTGHWLLFLRARGTEHRLTFGLTEPARVVEARASDFVLRDRESGLSLPSAALASVLSTR